MHNDIVKSFSVGILQYNERINGIHGLSKYLVSPSMKGGEYDQADWAIH